MNRITQHPLFWPAATLALLLLASSLFHPSFLALTWRDGHLYGSIIDILNRAAPLMVVSLGMTLVIAVRGLDISVGAVVAISAAVAALMIGGSFSATGEVQSAHPLWLAGTLRDISSSACSGVSGDTCYDDFNALNLRNHPEIQESVYDQVQSVTIKTAASVLNTDNWRGWLVARYSAYGCISFPEDAPKVYDY